MSIARKIKLLQSELPANVTLVAVSKTHPAGSIMEAYDAGQRIFGENRPQELKAKYETLPKDIRWHMIGHLQTNKVKYIAPFVELIHSADSMRLLEVIEREAVKNNRTLDVLLEIRIAQEDTKSGWEEGELLAEVREGIREKFPHVRFRGVMGIASLTEDETLIREEFNRLNAIYLELKGSFGQMFDTVSMGMTSDYGLAIECGSTMVRIGSLIFGEREYNKA